MNTNGLAVAAPVHRRPAQRLRHACFAVTALCCLAVAGCSVQTLALRQVGDALAASGVAEEDDMALARDAAPFYLKASEAVLREQPGHLRLAAAVASGFTQYAYAFVAFEADRIEAQDSRSAQRLRERAARLYRRANEHAMRALETTHPGLAAALARPDAAEALREAEIPVAYWAAASWAAWISLSKDAPDVVADLPKAMRLGQMAWLADPDHARGALASLLGTLEASRPGGSRSQADAYFARALAAGQGANAGVYVAMAEALAQPSGDRRTFEDWLRRAIDATDARRDLTSQVMRQRAEWLLEHADDLF